jgi:hypothetical protein
MRAEGHLVAETAAPSRRDNSVSLHRVNRSLGGRSFSSGITQRALARYLSRWCTRARFCYLSISITAPRSGRFPLAERTKSSSLPPTHTPLITSHWFTSTWNSQSSRNGCKSLKTRRRMSAYPERPGASKSSLPVRVLASRRGRKIRLHSSSGCPKIGDARVSKLR